MDPTAAGQALDGATDAARRLRHVYSRFADSPEVPWMLAAGAVIQAYRELTAHTNPILAAEGLTTSRAEVLQILDGAPDGTASTGALKRSTFLVPATMSYTLDWLEERGLVERQATPGDRRSMVIHITDRGRETWRRTATALSAVSWGLAGLGPDEAIDVARVLAPRLELG